MRRNGRPEDQEFSPDESLFRRCQIIDVEEVEGIKRLKPLSIKFPDLSVNRQKYGGQPEDALIPHWKDWGMATWKVSDVPSPLQGMTGTEFQFRPVHVPEEDNYYHCEIWTFRAGQRFQGKIPDRVKEHFRFKIHASSQVVIEPRI